MTAVTTINAEAELFWPRLDERAWERPKTLSIGGYGITRGAARMLDELATAGVTATWFFPAWIAEQHPALVRDVAAGGHEIGCLGVDATPLDQLTPDQARDQLREARDRITDAAGTECMLVRFPDGKLTEVMIDMAAAAGFTASSSTRAACEPITLTTANGTRLVDVPQNWQLTDYPYFIFNTGALAFPPSESRIAGYDTVLTEWLDELHAHNDAGLAAVFTFETFCIGTPGRTLLLRKLLAEVTAGPHATVSQLAGSYDPAAAPAETGESVRRRWQVGPLE